MKKWLRRLIQGIFLMIMAFSVVEIGTYLWERQKSNSEIAAVQKQLADLSIPKEASSASSAAQNAPMLDYEALMNRLKTMNKDVVAYIMIYGAPNQYPVLQAKDNDYYLRRGIDEKYSIQGIPFMDYQNKPDLTDQNTVLYGHMMYYGDEMFGILKHFLDQSYVDKSDNLFSLVNEKGIYTYRIFSVRQRDATDSYRDPNVEEKTFLNNLQEDLDRSEVNFHFKEKLSAKDRVVTLSTCTTTQDESKRIAVVGVLVKIENKERTVTREQVMSIDANKGWDNTEKPPMPPADASAVSK